MKRLSADGSVGSPHVRVGRCQALFDAPCAVAHGAFFLAPFSASVLTARVLPVDRQGRLPRRLAAIGLRFAAEGTSLDYCPGDGTEKFRAITAADEVERTKDCPMSTGTRSPNCALRSFTGLRLLACMFRSWTPNENAIAK